MLDRMKSVQAYRVLYLHRFEQGGAFGLCQLCLSLVCVPTDLRFNQVLETTVLWSSCTVLAGEVFPHLLQNSRWMCAGAQRSKLQVLVRSIQDVTQRFPPSHRSYLALCLNVRLA